jgi:hypothetical protein
MIHDWQAQCRVYIERIEMLELPAVVAAVRGGQS